MILTREVAQDTVWIGASDRRLELFENLFPLPNGVSYNSYVVLDEKITLFDTADVSVAEQYWENLDAVLAGRKPEYLVILHMEPDHCSQIAHVVRAFPDITLVGGMKTFTFLYQFFPELKDQKKLVVKEGDTLTTGKHTFAFVCAPMVHWPEVMMALDTTTGALYSADAFGTFGALEDSIFADDYDFEHKYLDEARRYYANIVGKYGQQVQMVLKKASNLPIKEILPLHGPVWRKADGIAWFIDKYQKWSTYTPETDEAIVVYNSLYGHTASAAETFAALYREKAGTKVTVYDVSKTDVSYLISEVWRCKKVVLFAATYNNGIYPKMLGFIDDMGALAVQNRTFAIAQNGTWAPVAGKLIADKLSAFKNVTLVENMFTFKSALHEADLEAFNQFVTDVANA